MRGPEGNLSCGDSQMKTTKAYLAGLGTTGIMIGATLLLVVLGTGFAAFDSLPARGASGPALERVVVDDDALPPAGHGKPLAGADRYRATPRLAVASGAKAGRRTGSGRAAREAGAGRIGGTRGWREVDRGRPGTGLAGTSGPESPAVREAARCRAPPRRAAEVVRALAAEPLAAEAEAAETAAMAAAGAL